MKKTITVERTAHYHILESEKKVDHILFVIHGYAQIAEDFIKPFAPLTKANFMVVAPEGLSKFYNKYRKVAASWMTAHEREDEIKDYLNYLNKLLYHIQADYPNTKLSLLGFSQGVSTAFRWASQLNKTTKFELFACSGSVPPELKIKDFENGGLEKVHYYYGDEDKLLSKEKAQMQMKLINELGLAVVEHPFHGKHEVPLSCLNDIKA